MNKVVFSSWRGKVIDNRGVDHGEHIKIDNLEIPLQYNDHQVRALMSWDGLVLGDEKVDLVEMTCAYMEEVRKLSCGECSLGYIGTEAMVDILTRISGGQGTREDIALLKWLCTGIKENAKCDFCALAVTPVLDALNYFDEEFLKSAADAKALPKSRYVVRVTAPCMEACPVHQDIPGYLELVKNRRFTEALALIRSVNCLPGVTGRACTAFCEANCVRSDIDSPLAIRALKRVPADYEVTSQLKPEFEGGGDTGIKVAIVGAGPAGLAAGYNLALMGYKVTIYDEQSSAGGMTFTSVPSYRLPRDVLGRETDVISNMGIEFKLNTRVGKDITLEQLSGQGFKAIFLAVGAHQSREFEIENWNKDHDGLFEGVDFLRKVNLGEKVAIKEKVIIVGGGNVAIDCARTCLRLGCKDVAIVYRRSRDEMPGIREEVEEAEQEGVKFHFLVTPVKILTEGNKLVGAECIKTELGEPDASGRRRPMPVKGSEFVIKTDMVISAIGEVPDLSFLSTHKPVETTEQGTIMVNRSSYQTNLSEIFSGGDCVTGPATIIEAIAAGNKAARSIDQYLQSGKVTVSEEDVVEDWFHGIDLNRRRDRGVTARKARQPLEKLALADRMLNFNEVEQCLNSEASVREAERCLRCYRVILLATSGK